MSIYSFINENSIPTQPSPAHSMHEKGLPFKKRKGYRSSFLSGPAFEAAAHVAYTLIPNHEKKAETLNCDYAQKIVLLRRKKARHESMLSDVKDENLSLLDKELEEAEMVLKMKGGFVVNYGRRLEKRDAHVKKTVGGQVESGKIALAFQKQIFHLMASEININDPSLRFNVKSFKVKTKLEGWEASYALFTLKEVLKEYQAEHMHNLSPERKQVQNQILRSLQNAYQLALKQEVIKGRYPQDCLEYYEALVEAWPLLDKLEGLAKLYPFQSQQERLSYLTQLEQEKIKKFFKSISFKNKGSLLSWKAIVNDIRLNAFNLIDHIKQGESQIFMLGSATHAVIVEVRRLGNDSYTWRIFNPGGYANQGGHQIITENDMKFIRPIEIANLKLEDLKNISLWETLILNFSVGKGKMKTFYDTIRLYLIEQAKGTLIQNQGIFGLAPQVGVCTTASICMYLDEHMTEKELQDFEKTKGNVCLQRQQMVNDFLQSVSEGQVEEEGESLLDRLASQSETLIKEINQVFHANVF